MKLDDTLTRNIAAETEDSQIERGRAIKKLASLEAGLQILNRFSRNKHAGWWALFAQALCLETLESILYEN